ncbi:MAG: hypothetical protein LBU09_02830, partial [Endomicrobium sp.]|nr:hypothetical protein [Endomicrobium sp.]
MSKIYNPYGILDEEPLKGYVYIGRDGKRQNIATRSPYFPEVVFSMEDGVVNISQGKRIFSLDKYDPVRRDKTLDFEYDEKRSGLKDALEAVDFRHSEMVARLFGQEGVKAQLKSAVDVAKYVADFGVGAAANIISGGGKLLSGAEITADRFKEENKVYNPLKKNKFYEAYKTLLNSATLPAGDIGDTIMSLGFRAFADISDEQKEELKNIRLDAIERAKDNSKMFYENVFGKGFEQKIDKWNKKNPFAAALSNTLGNTALVLGATVATKNPLLITALFYLNSVSEKYGEIYENYKAQGLSDDEAFLKADVYANTYAGIVGSIEYLGDLVSLGALKKIPFFNKGAQKVGKSVADSITKQIFKIAGSEGVEESLQNVVGDWWSNLFGGKDKGLGDVLKDAVYAGVWGAVGGLMFGGAYAVGGAFG